MVLGGWGTEAIFKVCLGEEERPQLRIEKICDGNRYDWEGLCAVLAKLVLNGSVCPAHRLAQDLKLVERGKIIIWLQARVGRYLDLKDGNSFSLIQNCVRRRVVSSRRRGGSRRLVVRF
jgi:hypothetical protein